jgi:hypothetical protein
MAFSWISWYELTDEEFEVAVNERQTGLSSGSD